MGWIIAVLVKVLMLPFKPVDVVGIRIVGIVATGDGEGVMMVFDAGAAWLETTESRSFADSMIAGPK